MDNFWIKVAIAVVMVVAVVVGINYFKGLKPEQPAPQEKTVGDVWREDDKRLRAPNQNGSGRAGPNIAPTSGSTSSPQAGTEQPKQMQFRQLTEEELAGAEQLFEMAIASRKMGRLPGMSYGQMVDYCRQIIEKYPGSEFEYKARRMLGEVPREQWERYKITEQEINPAQ